MNDRTASGKEGRPNQHIEHTEIPWHDGCGGNRSSHPATKPPLLMCDVGIQRMNTRHIMLLLVLVPQLLLGGNVDVTMGTEHILKFSRISESGVQDVGLWRQTMVSTQLVGRFIVEGDTIVSVLPTPISSDTHRPRAHFIEFGTGWELINKLFVDDQGRIWENGPGTNRTDIAPSKLSDHKFLALISDNPLILLSVQQGAPFSVVSEILRTISERNASVGLGWNPAHE